MVVSALIVFTLFRLELKQWRYTSSRDYLGIFQAVVVNTLVLAGFIAVTHPVTVPSGTGDVTISAPTGVMALFFLLTLVLVGGARFVARIVYEGPVRGFRARADARRVLIVGAGEGGRLVLREVMRNPQLGLDPVGFVDDDPLKRGIRVDGVKVLGPTDQLGRILDEAEPDEITIAIPSAPGHAARARGAGGAPARDPGAHAADRVRAAAGRLGPGRAPGARGAGRGHPGPRARAHGARPRRRLPRAARWS